MKIPVTHYADISCYEAIEAMKKEIFSLYIQSGMYDSVYFSGEELIGCRYNIPSQHKEIIIHISKETKDILKALETLSLYYFEKEND